ncbi:hypothetical protein ACQUET_12740, partial [Lactococcus lactis]|uniref:hypothetical protein n=1 Tax=Lactococcus lactis TaxID=1358 RepID=UPI003D12C121
TLNRVYLFQRGQELEPWHPTQEEIAAARWHDQMLDAWGILRYVLMILAFAVAGGVLAFVFKKIDKSAPWARPLLIVTYVVAMVYVQYTVTDPYQ